MKEIDTRWSVDLELFSFIVGIDLVHRNWPVNRECAFKWPTQRERQPISTTGARGRHFFHAWFSMGWQRTSLSVYLTRHYTVEGTQSFILLPFFPHSIKNSTTNYSASNRSRSYYLVPSVDLLLDGIDTSRRWSPIYAGQTPGPWAPCPVNMIKRISQQQHRDFFCLTKTDSQLGLGVSGVPLIRSDPNTYFHDKNLLSDENQLSWWLITDRRWSITNE